MCEDLRNKGKMEGMGEEEQRGNRKEAAVQLQRSPPCWGVGTGQEKDKAGRWSVPRRLATFLQRQRLGRSDLFAQSHPLLCRVSRRPPCPRWRQTQQAVPLGVVGAAA